MILIILKIGMFRFSIKILSLIENSKEKSQYKEIYKLPYRLLHGVIKLQRIS
jgi:hypothetical protein